jgi:hypothetical protein
LDKTLEENNKLRKERDDFSYKLSKIEKDNTMKALHGNKDENVLRVKVEKD